jgi:outer membrane protein TolC
VKVSESRYSVGRAAQQDVIRAQTQLSIHDLLFARVEQERATREGELNALLARPVTSPVGRPLDLQLTTFDLALDALVANANSHAPMLRRDQIMLDRSQLAIDAARKEYQPDFTLSGGYYNMGSMPPMYEFRFDVQVPLRRARRAAAVAERVNDLEQARSTRDGARLALQSRIQQEYQVAVTAMRLARLYHETVLPQARLGLESSMASYQTGAVDFLSVVTSFGAVLEYEMAYLDELATYHTAVSRLEEITGTPIVH